MNEDIPVICANCKHFENVFKGLQACRHPRVLDPIDPIYLVTGRQEGQACINVRQGGLCGQTGALFEASDAFLRKQHCTKKVLYRRPYSSHRTMVPGCEAGASDCCGDTGCLVRDAAGTALVRGDDVTVHNLQDGTTREGIVKKVEGQRVTVRWRDDRGAPIFLVFDGKTGEHEKKRGPYKISWPMLEA